MPHLFQSGVLYGQSAWHNLGTVLDETDDRRFNVDDTLELSGACFDVKKVPQFIDIGGEKVFTGAYATIRTDTNQVLGTVGDKYRPLQSQEQFSWFQPFLDTKDVAFETAGVLKEGAIVWALARILSNDGVIDVGDGDKINKYLMLYTSHDGSLATGVQFTPVRVVCWNTLSSSMGKGTVAKVRHTAAQIRTLNEIRDTVNLIDREFQATEAQYRSLKRKLINKDQMHNFMKIVFDANKDEEVSTRLANIIDTCIELAYHGQGNNGSSLWDAYNGVTEWLTHSRGKKENRAYMNQFGAAANINSRAFEVALSY